MFEALIAYEIENPMYRIITVIDRPSFTLSRWRVVGIVDCTVITILYVVIVISLCTWFAKEQVAVLSVQNG